MNYFIRLMTDGDIPAGMQLKALASWNQTEADWRVFLSANPAGCFAAVCNGQVVGTTTVIRYGPSLAWIGMVLVHPDHRAQGIATALMRNALEHAADCPAIKLDATAAGQRVYEALGFVEESTVKRLTTSCLADVGEPTEGVFPVRNSQWQSVLEMDRTTFGGDRTLLFETLRKSAPEIALTLMNRERIAACCLGRPGSTFTQLGPVIAESTEDAQRLTRVALRQLVGQPIVVDIPSTHVDFTKWLTNHGFTPQRHFVRMIRGENHI
ncbi:MAG: GNAT family N-acetyltransferase, partial [Pirellulaceae bacterium]